jgi:molybdopterin molybdotransferase
MSAPGTTLPRHRLDVAEAATLIGAHLPEFPAVRVGIDHCGGEILRETVRAERAQPPFDRVTMDGIALRHGAVAAGRRSFRVLGTQGAGAAPVPVTADDACVAIMTGAALPEGADTVVPVERIRREGDQARLEDGYTPAPGQFIHRRGSDHAAGQELLTPGTVLGPPEMAVLTIGGQTEYLITRRPAIAVISTGDELVDVGEPLGEAQIRSSNDRTLIAALNRRGFRRGTRARLPDDPDILRRDIGALLDSHDVLILSGGVSMGEFDYVPRILGELGLQLVFHKVLQRPGMPLWFGTADGKPVFALPGNPVSSLVGLVRYVIPGLLAACGARLAPVPRVRLAADVNFEPDLTWFLPVVLEYTPEGDVRAVPKPTNTSGDFVSLVGTDGCVELPRGGRHFPAGYAAAFYPW